jgi:hypothetical protein
MLLTPAQFKSYVKLPTGIADDLVFELIQQEWGSISDLLSYDFFDGENTTIVAKIMAPVGMMIELPVQAETIISITEGLTNYTVQPTTYILDDGNKMILRKPMGVYNPNYFDNVGYFGQYWQTPVTVTYTPHRPYIQKVRMVLTQLVYLRLYGLGWLGQGYYTSVMSEKTGEQSKTFFNAGSRIDVIAERQKLLSVLVDIRVG